MDKLEKSDKEVKNYIKDVKDNIDNGGENVFSNKYEYKEPDNIKDSLKVVAYMSTLLDFYFTQKERSWTFGQLLRMSGDDEDMWNVIASCVINVKTKLCVRAVPFSSLGLKGVLECFCVFAEGFMNTEVDEIFERFCSGVSQDSIFQLLNSLGDNVLGEDDIKTPANVLSRYITKALTATLGG